MTVRPLWSCSRRGCSGKALVTVRVETGEGPDFAAFCPLHVRLAAEYVSAVADGWTEQVADEISARLELDGC